MFKIKIEKIVKLNLNNVTTFFHHRSGWDFAISNLMGLHDTTGILMEDFIEKTFGWNRCENDPNDEKEIYYNDIIYYVKYKDIKLYKHSHAVELSSNLYVKYDIKSKQWIKVSDINIEEWDKSNYAYTNTTYNFPWIGFLHNPPNVPYWFDYQNSPQEILKYTEFINSLQHCEGIFVLSDYLNKWLTNYFKNNNINVRVNTLWHPTETPKLKFTWKKFKDNNNRKIVQNGYWLRNMSFIWDIKCDYTKVWLYSNSYAFECLKRELINSPNSTKLHKDLLDRITKLGYSDEEIISKTIIDVDLMRLNNDEYDKMLSENICVLSLYDSSCNNAIIECMVRNTPIIVNKIEPVVEYLGKDYPLYFNTIEEAEALLNNKKKLKKGYKYLKKMDKTRLSGKYFKKSLMDSDIYINLLEKYGAKYEYEYIYKTLSEYKSSSGSWN